MHLQNVGHRQQLGRADAACTLFVAPDLCDRHTERRAEIFLVHPQRLAAQPDTMADESVNGIGLAEHLSPPRKNGWLLKFKHA
ncbi:hypothetical protein EFR01_23030 [Sinorhizobium fredii]|nr:hypothetical protein EFR01_23030 [Sinorhizobium fredii]GLS07352.1 hypothetical protein GCM10007864_09790 [Sinorhizobium fredii]